MAASSQAEVLRAWGKLGYPRRALRLHECAGCWPPNTATWFPTDVDILLGLPGIGAYTARAVACFAYGQRVPVVDTNVRRVVARAVHGRAEPGNPSTTRDLADVVRAAPADPGAGRRVLRRADGTGRDRLHRPHPRLRPLPAARLRLGRRRTSRAHRGAAQGAEVRGHRPSGARQAAWPCSARAHAPVERVRLDQVWPATPGQRDRALHSLLMDGLVEQTEDGLFALAGEGS